MTSLQSLLAMRGAHMSPQPQVLALIIGSHSRLGSITDRVGSVLQDSLRQGELLASVRAAWARMAAPPGIPSFRCVRGTGKQGTNKYPFGVQSDSLRKVRQWQASR